MVITELITQLMDFKQTHGDVEIEATYFCADCNDEHITNELDLILTRNNCLVLSPTPLRMSHQDVIKEA